MNEQDNRPRCEHRWVYPMKHCTVCMKAEIERLQADLNYERERNANNVANHQLEINELKAEIGELNKMRSRR